MPKHERESPDEEPTDPPVVVGGTPSYSMEIDDPEDADAGKSLPPPAPAAPEVPAKVHQGPSALVCTLVSLVAPGIGQILLGQTAKGATFLLVAIFSLGFCGILNVLAAVDAWLIAQRRDRGETIPDWQFF